MQRLREHGLTARCRNRDRDGSLAQPGAGGCPGLIAEHEGAIPATFVGLGQRGKPSEDVADEAVNQLLAFEAVDQAAVDPHSADQILLPLALAEGRSIYTVSQITDHLRTNAATIRAFLDRPIVIEEPGIEGRPWTRDCRLNRGDQERGEANPTAGLPPASTKESVRVQPPDGRRALAYAYE